MVFTMIIILGGIKFTTKESMEIFADCEFGFDVKITYCEKNLFNRNEEPEILHNITEVHLYYETLEADGGDRHAFESNIHSSGCTKWTEHNVKEIEINNSEKKYEHIWNRNTNDKT